MSRLTHCVSCKRPLGERAYVSQGMVGVWVECEYCFTGTERPAGPELITDTFKPPEVSKPQRELTEILDAMLVPEQR